MTIQVSAEKILITVEELRQKLGENINGGHARNLLYMLRKNGLAQRHSRMPSSGGRPANVWEVPQCVTIELS